MDTKCALSLTVKIFFCMWSSNARRQSVSSYRLKCIFRNISACATWINSISEDISFHFTGMYCKFMTLLLTLCFLYQPPPFNNPLNQQLVPLQVNTLHVLGKVTKKLIRYHKLWIKHLACFRGDSIYNDTKYAVDIINERWFVNIAVADDRSCLKWCYQWGVLMIVFTCTAFIDALI